MFERFTDSARRLVVEAQDMPTEEKTNALALSTFYLPLANQTTEG